MYYTYILKSDINGSYYIGSSSDVFARLKMHNTGLVKSTKRYIPWQVVYIEQCHDLLSARQREFQIKSWKKRNAIEKLINKGP